MVICVKTLADELHGLKDASYLKMEPAYFVAGYNVCMYAALDGRGGKCYSCFLGFFIAQHVV